ncbi:Aldo/keto reductase [Neocallimastix californiae]|jgi:diketogulonate reductase-like aldo/keto reductase|uniref:Aldo/keto reductase n=1 Tax=Neocallimastix californiae TaxID=1754190 RepID=A0A1Y2EQF8_9FUNG|nr:Aldo/keto reductase [Neocallimastix californiae]|eukprot:ORY73767.1 Aldo/keto reductase [Neocallimastix californiae]
MELETVQLNDGSLIPKVGQGTWEMGENEVEEEEEIESIYKGIELGIRLIDTAEMYGEGGAEKVVGKAIQKAFSNGIVKREDLYIVSKVYPFNAGKRNIFRACENSLKRLGIEYLDLYLLHWRGNVPLRETVQCMEKLVKDKKIRRWGVSNLDVEDMEELLSIPDGSNCVVNQVLYHIGSRESETSLIPLQQKYGIPIMAYSPLARAGAIVRGRSIFKNELLLELSKKYNCSIFQIMLAFVHAQPNVITIPKSTKIKHLLDNFDVFSNKIKLSREDLQKLDDEFPAPAVRRPIDMV